MDDRLASQTRNTRVEQTFGDTIRLGLRDYCAGHVGVKDLRRRPFTSSNVFDDLRS